MKTVGSGITAAAGRLTSHAVRAAWRQRSLFFKLLVRDFAERYRGSYLGLLWSFILPLLSLLVFTFFFGVIFKMRWTGLDNASLSSLGLVLFIGLALYNFFAEGISRAPTLIVGRPNYVKSVVFPLEILPAVMVSSAFLILSTTLLLILIVQAVWGAGLSGTVWLLPVLLLPLLGFVLGLSWFLAALGVYIRDIQHLIVPLVQLMMFVSPVFYPLSALPERLQSWLRLNPLAVVIEQTRALILFGHAPDWMAYFGCLLVSLIVMLLGLSWFSRTRKGFADVL